MALDPDDERPAYVQVAEKLRTAIRSGSLKAGDKLPSARELAEQYKIAPMTARSAIRLLRDEGLAVARQGSGVFVRDAVPKEVSGDPVTTELAELRREVLELRERLEIAEQTGEAIASIQATLDRINARLESIDQDGENAGG